MTGRGSYPQNPTVGCIAARPRRELLLALHTWGPSLTEQRLAAYLAAQTQRRPSFETTETGTVKADLRHVHLPALEETGLITWRREAGRVETAAHPAFDDSRFERLLDLQTDGLDEVLAALAHDYRRIGLTVLEDEPAAMSRAKLGREVHRLIPESAAPAVPTVEEITTALQHVHLPKLDELDFIDFDPEIGQATYAGQPALEEVFTIIYGRDESATEQLDGFLGGLADTYQQARDGTAPTPEWPHFWRTPHDV